ncbi:hypothetical protein SK3146_06437 [Paenibacillus konkukensis]|uniref:Uncharacterized protein n=1 Tax=Paenibacillus konkukensis TaxID=2020716 RepID=A0ABY4RXQ9_9BACL|nr:hypothetical protein [Paenibacillus konkukensis]UQZ87141.1 hypothetical protein SK3146_06437 [Paenibacillus konkukensis]
MHTELYKQLKKPDDQESRRLQELMVEIKKIMSEKQNTGMFKRLFKYKQRPKTKPRAW